MYFPKYWAKHVEGAFVSWRWSDTSLAEAETLAAQAARQCAARFAEGKPLERYGYPDRPMREEVLSQIDDPQGAAAGVVTRNSYGCKVLNTPTVMFVDIDIEEVKPATSLGGMLKRLFTGKKPPDPPNPALGSLKRVAEWTQCHAGWGWRAYRTKGGLRLLATSGLFDPASPETARLFFELGADPLYARLCKVQERFRARLTPKAWRCGMRRPSARWPWGDASTEAEFVNWERDYETASAGFATCTYIGPIGNEAIHPQVAPIVAFHDQATRAESGLKLA